MPPAEIPSHLGDLLNLAPAICRPTTERPFRAYQFPWFGLESDLAGGLLEALWLVGYGSLLNTASAARTIRQTDAPDRLPVLVSGCRRIFNYRMSASVDTRFGTPSQPRERAALNVLCSGRAEDVINGILIKVSLEDLPALRLRERGYDLLPVSCCPWPGSGMAEPPNQPTTEPTATEPTATEPTATEPTATEPTASEPIPNGLDVSTRPADVLSADVLSAYVLSAYVLSASGGQRDGQVWTDDQLLPHRAYERLCREGAAEISELFCDFFVWSTWLADGVTPYAQWLAEQP